MKYRSSLLLCLMAALSAQANSQPGAEEPGSIAETEAQFLFINMLEFLGEFETEDGEWISPDMLGDDVFAILDASGEGQPERQEQDQRALSSRDEE